MKTILLEYEAADLWYNSETNSIESHWKMTPELETYKYFFSEAMKHVEQYKPTGWLSDLRKQGVVSMECTRWLKSEVVPFALRIGIKRIAVIQKPDVFQHFYVSQIEEHLAGAADFMKTFKSEAEANAWLKTVPG